MLQNTTFHRSVQSMRLLLVAFALLLIAIATNAEEGDSICFGLYPRSGAVQGTSSCPLIASSNTPVGMATYRCTAELPLVNRWCGTPPDAIPDKSCPVADPVYPGTGSTTITETDFSSGDATPIVFRRIYRARPLVRTDAGLGSLWFHNWQRQLVVSNAASNPPKVIAYREKGDPVTFSKASGNWRPTDGELLTLTQGSSSWTLTDLTTNTDESYSTQGALLSVSTHEGLVTTLTYSDANTPGNVAPAPGLLIAVTQHAALTNPYYDLTLRLSYDAKWRITQMTDPTGGIIQYGYDTYDNLVSVTWPDRNVRQYAYEDKRFTSALTGVIDETGSRIATWTYDATGRATAVSHPDTTRNAQFTYNNTSTTVTSGQNSTTLNFSSIAGVQRATGSSAGTAKTWDTSGNLLVDKGANGSAIEYTYDDAGRPIVIVQRGASSAAKTSVRYADAKSLRPSFIASPGKMRAYVYDAQGNVTGVSELTTDDPTGVNGFGASTASGQQRTYGFAYDSLNNVNFVQIYDNDIESGRWSFTQDQTGNLRGIQNRKTGDVYLVGSRDTAHRAAVITGPGFLANPVYDSRGRLSTFWYNEDAGPLNGNVTRLLKVTYNYSPDNRIVSRTGTVATNGGRDIAITSDEIDQWLDNYESRVSPAGPPVNLLGWAKALKFVQESGLEPVCVECWIPPVRYAITGISLLKPYLVKDTKSCQAEPELVQTVFESKILRQMNKRGWTKESVEGTIENPSRTAKTRDTRNLEDGSGSRDDPATAYVNSDGSYVIRNDLDGTIVQVSNRNNPGWLNPF